MLTHLKNKEILDFLARAKESLREGGLIVVKENFSTNKEIVDEQDCTIIRTNHGWKSLFYESNTKIFYQQEQPDWPKELYPVKMWALIWFLLKTLWKSLFHLWLLNKDNDNFNGETPEYSRAGLQDKHVPKNALFHSLKVLLEAYISADIQEYDELLFGLDLDDLLVDFHQERVFLIWNRIVHQ